MKTFRTLALLSLFAAVARTSQAHPAAIDWRDYDVILPVQDQGHCDSGWAVASAVAMAAAYAIQTGNLVPLSYQELVDCSSSYGNNGCSGGFPDYAFDYATVNGLVSTETYVYTATTGSCQLNGKTPILRPRAFKDVLVGDEDALLDAVAQQPVVVGVESDQLAFQFYSSGVFSAACGTSIDTYMLVVGYDTQASPPYWIVQNSWGASWGEQGYIRLAMGKNECGIANAASYPIVLPPSATNVAISGGALPGDSLTGSYTFTAPYGYQESGSTYQWYTVSNSTLTAIPGATSESYFPPQSETVEFCVTPADTGETGVTTCSSPFNVIGMDWFSGESQTGTRTPEVTSNGACVNLSDLGLQGKVKSLALYGTMFDTTTMYMFTGPACTGLMYTRSAGVGTVHDINLDSVGIGQMLTSYRVTW